MTTPSSTKLGQSAQPDAGQGLEPVERLPAGGLPAKPRSLRHRLVVHAVVKEAPGVYSVLLRGRHLDRLPVRAGQFCTWRFLSGPGWTRGSKP